MNLSCKLKHSKEMHCFTHSRAILKKCFSAQNLYYVDICAIGLCKIPRKFIPLEFIKSRVRYHFYTYEGIYNYTIY